MTDSRVPDSSAMIDVVIPVFNVVDYIDRCVKSVLGQTNVNVNVVLVDDGSSDGSSETCDALASMHSNVSAIHKKNGGVSSARNAGMKSCSSEYITFVDPDDYLDSGMLSCLLSVLEAESADIATCGIVKEWCDGSTSLLCQKLPESFCGQEVAKNLLSGTLFSGVLGKLFKRKSIGTITFASIAMSEDALFLVELSMTENLKMVYVENAFYHYWQREGSVRLRGFNEKQLDSLICADEVERLVRANCPSLVPYAAAFVYEYYIGTLSRLYAWKAADGHEDLVIKIENVLRKHTKEANVMVPMSKRLAWRLYRFSPKIFSAASRLYYSRTLYRGLSI